MQSKSLNRSTVIINVNTKHLFIKINCSVFLVAHYFFINHFFLQSYSYLIVLPQIFVSFSWIILLRGQWRKMILLPHLYLAPEESHPLFHIARLKCDSPHTSWGIDFLFELNMSYIRRPVLATLETTVTKSLLQTFTNHYPINPIILRVKHLKTLICRNQWS